MYIGVTIVDLKQQGVLHILSVCVCVCLALVFQHATRMRHVVIRGLPGCTTILYVISWTALFCEKKVTELKMCVLAFVRKLSHYKDNLAIYYYICSHFFLLSTYYSSHILINLELSQRIFEKNTWIQFSRKSAQWEPISMWTDILTWRS